MSANPHPKSPHSQSPKDRARILLELLRDKKTKSGFDPLLSEATVQAENTTIPSPEALKQSARELLERINQQPTPTTPSTRLGAMPMAILRSTIAALVDGSRLAQEHPSVIALVIAHQSRKTQATILRGLPAQQARRVQRALRFVRVG